MEPLAQQEFLIGVSQLGAVYIGFMSMVVAVSKKEEPLTRVISGRVRGVLGSGFLAMFGAIAPLMYYFFGFEETMAWRLAAGSMIVASLFFIVPVMRVYKEMSAEDMKAAGRFKMAFILLMAFGGLAVLGVLAAGWGHAGYYVLALDLPLIAGALNFIWIAEEKWL